MSQWLLVLIVSSTIGVFGLPPSSHRTRLLDSDNFRNSNNFDTESRPQSAPRYPSAGSFDLFNYPHQSQSPSTTYYRPNPTVFGGSSSSSSRHPSSFSPSSNFDNHHDGTTFMKRFGKHGDPMIGSGTSTNTMMNVDEMPMIDNDGLGLGRGASMSKLAQNHPHHNHRNQLNSPNVCTAPDFRSGVCYDAAECSDRGGIPMGRCSRGSDHGSVCCLFETTCGQMSISEQHVYFRSPGFPAPFEQPQICRTKINKIQPQQQLGGKSGSSSSSSICQLKLTFRHFDIAKPIEGNCTQDIFAVSGQNENNIVPRICGLNSGQHYYIAVDESGLINLQMILRGLYPRKFDIHIEQIACDSKDLAPPHCLQFYDGTQGRIKSFNYDYDEMMMVHRGDMADGSQTTINEGYPNNVDYLICLRKETGFCSVSYEFMSDHQGQVLPFSIGLQGQPQGLGQAGAGGVGDQGRISSNGKPFHLTRTQSAATNRDCEDDYLIVGGMRLCSHFEDSDDDHHNGHDDNSIGLDGGNVTTTTRTITNDNDSVVLINGNNGNNSSGDDRDNPLAPPAGGTASNGELYENSRDEVSEVEGSVDDPALLRRTHRRAAAYYNDHGGYVNGGDDISRLHDSVPRRRQHFKPSKRHQPNPSLNNHHSNLMAVDSTPGPFQLRFVSNGQRNARGFYLAYRQNPCRI